MTPNPESRASRAVEFARDLFRPFGPTRLGTFARKNWIAIFLLGGALWGGSEWRRASVGPSSPPATSAGIVALDPATIRREDLRGFDLWALDPAGRYLVFFDGGGEWTIWDREEDQCAARFRPLAEDGWNCWPNYMGTPCLYHETRHEFLVATRYGFRTWIAGTNDAWTMLVGIDARTGALRWSRLVEGDFTLFDVSRDGGIVLGGVNLRERSDFRLGAYRAATIDLDGGFRVHPPYGEWFAMDDAGRILCSTFSGIFAWDPNTRRSGAVFAQEESGNFNMFDAVRSGRRIDAFGSDDSGTGEPKPLRLCIPLDGSGPPLVEAVAEDPDNTLHDHAIVETSYSGPASPPPRYDSVTMRVRARSAQSGLRLLHYERNRPDLPRDRRLLLDDLNDEDTLGFYEVHRFEGEDKVLGAAFAGPDAVAVPTKESGLLLFSTDDAMTSERFVRMEPIRR